jgi:hypothetical protein
MEICDAVKSKRPHFIIPKIEIILIERKLKLNF